MRLCGMGRCSNVFGFWSFVALLFPILDYGTGAFAFTEYVGSYLPALWRWLTADS
jgi:hypothetical protein